MKSDVTQATILAGLQIRRGRIVEITTAGEIRIEKDPEGLAIPCDFLRTSSAPLPELLPGDFVLYALDVTETRGYVLGVIQKYQAIERGVSGKTLAPPQQDFREIKLNAEEKIELRCGKSLLTMDKDGKVLVRGATVTSRARGTNKIKGGAVQIN